MTPTDKQMTVEALIALGSVVGDDDPQCWSGELAFDADVLRAALEQYGKEQYARGVNDVWPAGRGSGEPVAVEPIIDAYLDDYETAYDEGSSAPDADTKFVIKDAIMGLFADDEFVKAVTPQPSETLTEEQIEHLRGLDTGARVRFYEHDFYPLSNFSAFTLYWRGLRFDTSEAAYHFEKFPNNPEIRAAIKNAPSAHVAFKIAEAQKPRRRKDWDAVKVSIMREILRTKVDQHEYVKRKLLDAGDRELVEDSWRDDFWGWGPNRDGQNMLGKLWMEIREELRAHNIRSAK